MRWIDTTALKNWAPRIDCRERLPLMIRRLIRATIQEIFQMRFPAGDAIDNPGWDGILEVPCGNEYVPAGISGWEISSSQHFKDQAEKNYQKRKKDPLGIEPSKTTFCFVTPLVWPGRSKGKSLGKDDWCNEKKKEGFWKDVRAYDATILEEWLEQAPAVGSWLARIIGKYPPGVIALEDFWVEWSSVTTPKLTPELTLAGRAQQSESVRNWMKSTPGAMTVRATTRKEAIAFLASVIYTLPESEKDFWFCRSIVVEDTESFRQLTVTRKSGLLLIAGFKETEETAVAPQRGHHVYVPIEPDNTVTQEKTELPRPGRDAFISALQQMGLSEDDAKTYSKETGRSLTVLRRRLMRTNNQPEWAKPDTARDLISMLLTQQYTERSESDKAMISKLAGKPYDSYSGNLNSWLHKSDSPIIKIGDLWRLLSPMDAWFALASYITEADLKTFDNVIKEIFGSIDPALELEPEERWLAPIHHKVPLYSHTLREGIAQTLVLMSVFGEEARMQASMTPKAWVDGVVRRLLHEASWQLWHSLSDILPLIAEASPDSFLDAVESSLSQDEPPIMNMFSETQGAVFSTSSHTGLLWALEGLAWSPELLGRVTLILGKLARLDPGGKLSNRPAGSLYQIYFLLRPQTHATLEQRLQIIDILIEREPEAGWNLLIALIQGHQGISLSTPRTRWREFPGKFEARVPYAELFHGINEITKRILEHVGISGQRWNAVIERIAYFLPEERQKVIEQLLSCAHQIDSDRTMLWDNLRKMLSYHRSFPDAKWALSEQELKEIEKIYNALEPQDTIERFCWLFDDGCFALPEGRPGNDFKETEKIIAQQRIDAVNKVKTELGLNGLVKLANQITYPWTVGIATPDVGLNDDEEHELLSLLEEKNEKALELVQSYIRNSAIRKSIEWINDLVQRARSEQWQPEKIVNLFVALPEKREVWDLVESFNNEIQRKYWEKCPARFFDIPSDDKIYAIEKLLNAKRHASALNTAGIFKKELPISLIVELLRKIASQPSVENRGQIDHYHLMELFKILDDDPNVLEKDLTQLEWLYLPVLADIGSSRPPKLLHKELAENPNSFAEVIKWLYKPEDENVPEENELLSNEQIEQRANRALELLSTWKTVPGSDQSGKISYDKLREWVQEARKLCKDLHREKAADIHIGKVLAYSISEEENVWPPEPVCKIIDEIKSKVIDDDFVVEIHNKRGVVTKSPFEGGQQERALAEQYRKYADHWITHYPITASLLKKVAEGYENDARREDKEAEGRDSEY